MVCICLHLYVVGNVDRSLRNIFFFPVACRFTHFLQAPTNRGGGRGSPLSAELENQLCCPLSCFHWRSPYNLLSTGECELRGYTKAQDKLNKDNTELVEVFY